MALLKYAQSDSRPPSHTIVIPLISCIFTALQRRISFKIIETILSVSNKGCNCKINPDCGLAAMEQNNKRMPSVTLSLIRTLLHLVLCIFGDREGKLTLMKLLMSVIKEGKKGCWLRWEQFYTLGSKGCFQSGLRTWSTGATSTQRWWYLTRLKP